MTEQPTPVAREGQADAETDSEFLLRVTNEAEGIDEMWGDDLARLLKLAARQQAELAEARQCARIWKSEASHQYRAHRDAEQCERQGEWRRNADGCGGMLMPVPLTDAQHGILLAPVLSVRQADPLPMGGMVPILSMYIEFLDRRIARDRATLSRMRAARAEASAGSAIETADDTWRRYP